jgi:DNA-binding FadR family transcriptional regulator
MRPVQQVKYVACDRDAAQEPSAMVLFFQEMCHETQNPLFSHFVNYCSARGRAALR